MNLGDTTFTVPVAERQLFPDDYGISKIESLSRTMHSPDKKGAVVRPDVALGFHALQIRMAPIWSPEKEVWQLWDCASEPSEINETGVYFSGYYESTDGLHWSKPEIGQVEYRGTKANNLVTVVLGGVQHSADCIVRDDTDPDPNRRYKTATPNVFDEGKGGYAVSPDGIRWSEISHPGISSGDEWNLTFDEREHLFVHYLKRRAAHGRAIWLTTSKDFSNWSEPELIFEADDLDQTHGAERIAVRLADPAYQPLLSNDPSVYNVDVYHMCPFRYESAYFGMPAFYHAVCPGFCKHQHRRLSRGRACLEPQFEELVPAWGSAGIHRTVSAGLRGLRSHPDHEPRIGGSARRRVVVLLQRTEVSRVDLGGRSARP